MKIKVNLENYKEKNVRVNKYLADSGIFSRREADKIISEKKIHINNKIAILGDKVKNGDSIFINQKLEKFKYFLYNKPRGEETTFKIIDKIRYEPIGRLDKESEGLLIYSNDYSIVEQLLNPKNGFEREYYVTVRENTSPRVKEILERGIVTKEGKYSPAKKVTLDEDNKKLITITLTEGKKHEIRRMLNALNLTIISLKRVRFLFLKLNKIKPGQMKELSESDTKKLLETIKTK